MAIATLAPVRVSSAVLLSVIGGIGVFFCAKIVTVLARPGPPPQIEANIRPPGGVAPAQLDREKLARLFGLGVQEQRDAKSEEARGYEVFGIRRVSRDEFVINPRAGSAYSRPANVDYLDTAARIVPWFEDGVCRGFRITSLMPGSLYALLGFERNDVISSVNGFEINSPERALEVYAQLRGRTRFDVLIVRRGKRVRMGYTVAGSADAGE